MRPLERCCKTVRRLARAERCCNEHGGSRRPAQECAEQLDRRRVGPVEVVEHEYERPRLREMLEQRAHGPMAAIALVLKRNCSTACERRQRRQHLSELCLYLVVEGRERVGV